MLKAAKNIFVFLSVSFFTFTNTFGQSLVQSVGDVMISPDVFPTGGITRRGDVDVQLSTGKVVFVYLEKEAASNNKDVWCVIYDHTMTVLVSPFRINTTTNGDQSYPFIRVHQNDNSFYVTWAGNQTGNNDIYLKKISLDITDATTSSVVSTADIPVNNLTSGEQIIPMMAINHKYNEVVVGFRDQGGNDGAGATSYAVFLRRFNSALASVNNQFLAHSFTSGNQVINAMDMKNDYLVVSYASNHVSANAYDIYTSTFLATDPPGNTPLTYTNIREIRVNNYLSGDQNNSHVSINETSDEYVVTWSSPQDGSGTGVYAKIYNTSTGSLVKDEFIVNTVTTNNQLLSKVCWEESTHQLLFFFHYSVSNFSTLKYRIYDGASIPGQFNPINTENDLIEGLDTKNYYSQNYNIAYNYYTNRIYLTYDIYDSYTTYNSKLRARTYIFKHPDLITPYFINNTDLNRNWIQARTYGEDGSLISETRQYYDSLANLTQSQSRNIAEGGTILAGATVYDVYNRGVLQTLPAPIPEKLFTLKNDFITPAGGSNRYQYNDFDKPSTVGNLSGEINNPKPVNNMSLLGKYYSDNNMYESMVGTTGFPYARTNFNDKVYGGVISKSSQGEALRMGAGHEVKAVQLPVLNELDHYLQLKKLYFGSTSASYSSLAFRAVKTITVDPNGVESIAFVDLDNRKIASAQANGTASSVFADLSYNASILNLYANPYVVYYNFKVSSSSELLEIRGLQNNDLLFSGYASELNISGLSLNQPVQVRSSMPFKISYTTRTNIGGINNFEGVSSTDFLEGNSVLDFYLKNPASLSLSLSPNVSLPFESTIQIKVSNLLDGTIHYTGSYDLFNYSNLPSGAGFYRIELVQMPVIEDYTPSSKYLRVNFSFPYSDWTYYFYDLKGNKIGEVAPKGINQQSTGYPKFVSQYTYSSTGKALSTKDPDRGLAYYVYRKDGKLRFAQNAKQLVTGKFSYTNYDGLGRVTEIGEYDPSLTASNARIFVNHRTQDTTTANPNSVHVILEETSIGGGLQSTSRTQVNYILYDFPAFSPSRTQSFLRGRVSATAKKNVDTENLNVSATWYSYDERGRVIWMDQSLDGLGIKTYDYTYLRELLTNTIYQKNTTSERFEHRYSYDAMQRVRKVETSAGAALFQTEALYSYYLHGPLKRKELGGNLQGIDYVYTVQGWLKGINHPELSSAKDPGHDGAVGSSFSKDVFGMSVDYYQNDYVRTNSNVVSTTENSLTGYLPYYTGNIRSITWQTSGQSIGGNPCQYAYTYDYNYQLLSAVFGTNSIANKNFIPDAAGKYNTFATYDPNGNLLTLNNNRGAVAGDQYSYKFGLPASPEYTNPVSNKLQHLINGLNANDTRLYQYDEIGQLMNETRGSGAQKNLIYNSYGKVEQVRDASNNLKVSFVYNERGQRIKKITYGTVNTVTWYVVDASGNVLSIYDDQSGTMTQTEIPVYGTTREGVVHKNGVTLIYSYELKDHVGSVRATVDRVKQPNGDATLLSWADYLVFGEVNPERNYAGADENRHKFQGEYAEHDAETEWEAFELRMYDARIGRWLSPDPMNQYWSPYTAMGNNPVIIIDPTGGSGEPSGSPDRGGPPEGTQYTNSYGTVFTYMVEFGEWVKQEGQLITIVGFVGPDSFGERDMKAMSSMMFANSGDPRAFGYIDPSYNIMFLRKTAEILGDVSQAITYGVVTAELGALYFAPETLVFVVPIGMSILTVSNQLDAMAEIMDVTADIMEGKWSRAGGKMFAYGAAELVTGGYVPKNVVDSYVTDHVVDFVTDQVNQYIKH